jgi:hypothetical protein
MMHGAMIGNVALVVIVVLLQGGGRYVGRFLARHHASQPDERAHEIDTRHVTRALKGRLQPAAETTFTRGALASIQWALDAVCGESTLLSSVLTSFSLLLMPTIAVAIGALFGSSSPGPGVVLAAVVTLVLWVGFPLYLSYVLLVRYRPMPLITVRERKRSVRRDTFMDGRHPNTAAATIRQKDHRGARRTVGHSGGGAGEVSGADAKATWWLSRWCVDAMLPDARWRLVSSTSLFSGPRNFRAHDSDDIRDKSHRLGRVMFSEYGILFDGFYSSRYWYFTVEFALAMATGVVVGASFAVTLLSSGDDAPSLSVCRTVQWCGGVLAALALLEMVLCGALKPHLVRWERWSTIIVALLTASSELAAIVDADGDGTISSAIAISATIVQLLSFLTALVNVALGHRPWRRLSGLTGASAIDPPSSPTTTEPISTKPSTRRQVLRAVVAAPPASGNGAVLSRKDRSMWNRRRSTASVESNLQHLIKSICEAASGLNGIEHTNTLLTARTVNRGRKM